MRTRTMVRCVVAMAAAVALVVGFVPSAASAAETGSIAGTVRLVDDTVPSWTRVCAERIEVGGGGEGVCGEFAPDGSYQLNGLPPGEYFVWFQARTEVPCEAYFEEAYENNHGWDFSSLVPVTAGAVTADIDAVLSTNVYGYVRDERGHAVQGATVAAYADDDIWLPTGTAVTDADGLFNLDDLLAGSYRLVVAPPSGSALRWQWFGSSTGFRSEAASQQVAICNEWTQLAVTLESAGAMVGTVSFNTGDPAEGTRVAAYRTGAWLPSATVIAGTDGSYAFTGLPDGDYQIVTRGPAGVTRPSVWVGGTGRANATVHEVTAGTSITGIDITVPYASNLPVQTVLSGTVQHKDGIPAVGATVAAYGTSNGVLPRVTVPVAADGTFTFEDLPPDTYRLLVRVPSGTGSTLAHYWHAEPGVTDRSRAAAATFDFSSGGEVEGVAVVYPSS